MDLSIIEWQRRAVPVTLVELIKHDLKPAIALKVVAPLILDVSQYVQKELEHYSVVYEINNPK